jgi:hypothetical protein
VYACVAGLGGAGAAPVEVSTAPAEESAAPAEVSAAPAEESAAEVRHLQSSVAQKSSVGADGCSAQSKQACLHAEILCR